MGWFSRYYVVFIHFGNGVYQYEGETMLTSDRSEAMQMSEDSAKACCNYYHDNPIAGMVSVGYELA